jgi:ubiquinone/menaquinone biosynthesis C-methylase UbiE
VEYTGRVTVGTSHLMSLYLDRIREFYDAAQTETTWFGRFYRSLLAKYYCQFIPPNASILEIGCGSGDLLSRLPNRDVTGVDLSNKQIAAARQRIPHGVFITAAAETLRRDLSLNRTFDYIILSDTVNFSPDVQTMLERLQDFASPDTRLILNFQNTVWYPLLKLATILGLKSKQPLTNWLSSSDVRALLDLANWEVIHQEERIVCPFPLLGLDRLLNRFVPPLLPWISLTIFQIARSRETSAMPAQSVSVIVPARNEAGNIDAVVERIPLMGPRTEVIFIEGHSKDETWVRIKNAIQKFPQLDIKAIQQTGIGKGNAVREAFVAASGDILMILDADLTVPPEDLPKFYAALVSGRTEFANGVRLVYPMDGKAMRFFNMCANKFFSVAFTWVLGQPIKDTLCGTKALFRRDYLRIAANRKVFGDFDPFGDFDLLFGARKLNRKISDIPIRYQERTYGTTNIHRWSHGMLLFRMLLFGLMRLKMI